MFWIVKSHRRDRNSATEINASLALNYLATCNIADTDSFEDKMKQELAKITRTNSYNPEFSYKIVKLTETSFEVWKMKADGDFNYKMFTVTKDPNYKENVFNF